MTKWGDRPHWEFGARLLGEDEHGHWLGVPTGTPMARPGLSLVTETDQVCLVPRPSHGGCGAWVATFHAPGIWVSTYVDMTSVPNWEGDVCRAVDLDLDVIRTADDEVYVDDQDEFVEHQARFGYPADTVALAEQSSAWVHHAVVHELAPFDGEHRHWLEQLASA